MFLFGDFLRMFRLIFRRFISLFFVILSVTFITFLVGYFAPGDPIRAMMGAEQDQATYDRLIHLYGLDLPWYEQYGKYVGGLLQGDLGLSYRFQGRPVWTLIENGVPMSLALGLAALSLALAIGIPLGAWTAIKQNTTFDRFSMILVLAGYSIPSFVLIPIFRWVNYQFYLYGLPSLPVAGWGRLEHWIMPTIILAVPYMSYIVRLTRATMLEVLHQDYMRTAWSKGLSASHVYWRHGFRNAMLPVITYIGPALAFLVTGAFVIETLFVIPGIGFLSIQAVAQRDYPVIQGTTLLLALALVVTNLVVDLLYLAIDPRVKLTS